MKRLLLAATATAVLSGPAWAAGVCDTPPYDSNPATTEFVQKTSPITEHAIQIACKAKHRDEYVDDPEMPQIMYGMKTAFGTDLDAKLDRDPAVIAMDWTNALAQTLKN